MTTYRIISETRSSYLLKKADAEKEVSKNFCKEAFYVGDWVTSDGDQLTLEERKNLVTKASNITVKNDHQLPKEQVMASNVDQILILMALDNHFSLAKLERYYLVFYQKGIDLHIILTKKDLVSDSQAIIDQVRKLYPQVQLIAINNQEPADIAQVKTLLKPDSTVLLLGASGAGKSTLLNNLLGRTEVKTSRTRSDGKGRHTTTSSLLLDCPDLKIQIIDTPGFKGIDKVKQLDLSLLFEEILDLAQLCHFPNCKHQSEPKCAVKAALADGKLSQELWQRYCHHSA